jgi:uncharacterized membrane protein
MEKAELMITALQQRIGELTANYELQLASIRADYTQVTKQLQDIQDKQKAADEYSQSLSQITEQATA